MEEVFQGKKGKALEFRGALEKLISFRGGSVQKSVLLLGFTTAT